MCFFVYLVFSCLVQIQIYCCLQIQEFHQVLLYSNRHRYLFPQKNDLGVREMINSFYFIVLLQVQKLFSSGVVSLLLIYLQEFIF